MTLPSSKTGADNTGAKAADSLGGSYLAGAYGPRSLQALSLLSLATCFIARGLAESLPGTFVGYDAQIGWMIYFGAFLSQFLTVAGAAAAIRFAADFVAAPNAGWLLPSFALVAAATEATYVLFSAQPHDPGLDAVWLLALATLPCAALLVASLRAAREREGRATALFCLGATVAATTLLAAKALAFLSSEDAHPTLFYNAQIAISLSLVLRATVASAVYLWWATAASNGRLAPRILIAIVGLFASALWVGRNSDGLAPVLLLVLQHLGSDPAPLFNEDAEALLELWIFGASVLAALVSISSPKWDASSAVADQAHATATVEHAASSQASPALEPVTTLERRSAVSLSLLACVIPDQPLGGLLLTLAALLLLRATNPLPRSLSTSHVAA